MKNLLGTKQEGVAARVCLDCKKLKKLWARDRCKTCYNTFRILYSDQINRRKQVPAHLTQEQSDILTGLMLGDGSLCGYVESTRTAYLRINRSVKDIEYARAHFNVFKEFINADDVRIFSRELRDKEYQSCTFHTLRSSVFGSWHEKWYQTRQKQVPLGLSSLSDLALAVWFCDDGCIVNKSLKLATHSFDEASVNILKSILIERFGDGFRLQKEKTGWSLHGRVEHTKNFIDACKSHITTFLPRKLKT